MQKTLSNDQVIPSTGFEGPEALNISTLFLKCMIKKKSSSHFYPSFFSVGLVISLMKHSFGRIIVLDSFYLFFPSVKKCE